MSRLLITLAPFLLISCQLPADAEKKDGSTKSDATADAGVTDPDSGLGTWDPQLMGVPCQQDGQCPGGACLSIFSSGAGKTCWKRCQSEADCFDFRYESDDIRCANLGDSPAICIALSGQNGPCGNGLNATCGDPEYQLCAVDDNTGFDQCLKLCLPSDPYNSAACAADGVPESMCGCASGDGCSTMRMFLGNNNEPTYGVCSAETVVGDYCGIGETDFVVSYCTGDQDCDWADEHSGSCMVTDAGVVTLDAGSQGEDAASED